MWDYAKELKLNNLGTLVDVLPSVINHEAKKYIKSFYMCFDSHKKGCIEGCTCVIVLDGCFLNARHIEELLSAVRSEGNNQKFPITWTVVQKETKFYWS